MSSSDPPVRRLPLARRAVRDLAASKVREVANAGFGREGVLRFWFGEGDQPTPDYIREAAIRSLTAGRTFYTHNQGKAELREAIALYLAGLHDVTFDPARISVASSGVSALMVAMQAIIDPGDRVVAVTPVWPNLTEIPRILGAEVVCVGLQARQGVWRLDLDQLLAAITPETRLVLVNSPNNPTGWVIPAEDREPLLAHCRRVGAWILTDDVYERLVFGNRGVAPSLLALADAEDRVIGANSFSKAWRMTGWRLGWIVAPPGLEADIGKLLEYNTSCAPDFVQAGAVAALEFGEGGIQALRADLIAACDQVSQGLAKLPGIDSTRPEGGLYAFFRIRGHGDSVATAKRLIAEAGLGLAPGAAFGPEGEGWLRWCFATDPASIEAGLDRLAGWLA